MSTVTINWIDDEVVSVQINANEVAYASHEQHGWAGVKAVIDTATAVAEALGAEVRTEGTPNQ